MSYTDQTGSAPGGFGKMLNSLQGLQQRLEDFSIADVTNAEANARTLIQRLQQFQDTIGAIALVKTAAANIDQSIAEIQQLDTEVVGTDSLENHPQLHAIVNASKLIKLHKLMAALKAGADVGESQDKPILDPVSAAAGSVERSEGIALETAKAIGAESVDSDNAAGLETSEAAPSLPELVPTPLTTATIVSSSVLETTADSPIRAAATGDTGALHSDALADFPTAETEFETAVAAAAPDSLIAEDQWPDFPAPAEQLTDSQVTLAGPLRVEFGTNLPQPLEPKQDLQIAPVKKSKARNKAPGQVDPSKALVPANDSFDLRLLDDLVSNYGEFASNPNLPATVKKKELQSVEPAANKTHKAQPEHSDSVEAAAPAVKKHGDLDRQLKKIIKDYGEYDIYSDKQTTNIKKAGILAFVFLGLVFGGIYLFKTPPPTAQIAPATSNSSSTKPDDRISRPAVAETTSDSRETALGAIHDNEKTTTINK